MATVGEAIRSVLAADDTIAALVTDNRGTRIRPLRADRFDVRPFINHSTTKDERIIYIDGSKSDFGIAVITLSIVADTATAASDLSVEIQRVLHGYVGTIEGVRLAPVTYVDETEIDVQEVAPKEGAPVVTVYVRDQQYRVQYRLI